MAVFLTAISLTIEKHHAAANLCDDGAVAFSEEMTDEHLHHASLETTFSQEFSWMSTCPLDTNHSCELLYF